MANTSLAEQLKKLAAPHTKLLTEKKKKPSLLFHPSEAAAIDRATFYEIGLGGLNELIEINEAFKEFKDSLFDETSKNFERTIESSEVNKRLDVIIKKLLCSLSPYYLLKPSQKVLEWLITRFYIHDYNIDDLICITLPYHGTRFFARLLQVFDLKNSKKWQWLHPVQKKGVPLSKSALFNHCATDVSFLKMICEVTVETVKLYGPNASKLSTHFGFYSTTVVGAIQHMNEITEFYLTDMLPSIFYGLGSDCVDFTASALVIIASILAKASLHERIHRKLAERITNVRHASLRNSVVLILNVLYQSCDENQSSISPKAVKNIIKNSDWFISSLSDFISSGSYSNVFYLLLMRDSLKLVSKIDTDQEEIRSFIHNLLISCRVDDFCAEKLIKFIINEVENNADDWSCELVQGLERQYPTAWDNVISVLFKEHSSESLGHILGLTSVTSQVQMFEKLNHVNSVVRIEALKHIAENISSIKIKYIKESLIARWNDDNPKVIETMFSLPKEIRFCSPEIVDRLLLKCWEESNDEWYSLLLRIVEELDTESDLKNNATKYTVLLFPFWISSSAEVQKRILDVDLPFFKSIKEKLKLPFTVLMKKSVLPSVEDLLTVYEELPKDSVNLVTILLLFGSRYASTKEENKLKILSFVTEEILASNFKKLEWNQSDTWDDIYIEQYYERTKKGKFPPEAVHKFFTSMMQNTTIPEHFNSRGWWDFSDKFSTLISKLYKSINSCFTLNEETDCNLFISSFVEKHFKTLSDKITFLCNICIQHKADTSVQNCAFRMINTLLKKTDESYSWAMSLKSDNIVVPSILIFLYSKDSELRSSVMETIEIIATSLSSGLVSELTYLDLLKYILQYKSEIILDKEQLLSTIYAFLAQDKDVQSILPVSVRCFTRTILESIINHIADPTTPISVSASLMVVLEFIKDTSSITQLVEYADRVVKSSDTHDDNGSFVLQNVIDKLHANDMKMYDTPSIRNFVKYCIENGSKIKINTERGPSCVNASLLRKLAVDIFDKMDDDMKKLILDSILKICSQGDNIDLISAANSFVKKASLDCQLLVPYLETMKNTSVEKKPKRNSGEVIPSILDTSEWKCGVALMELIQNKKKIYNCHVILPLLFEVLQKCCEIDDQMAVEYAKQICLSCALNCSQKLISENRFDIEKLFNVELVVSCIRMSPNPQTHHHALLLLAHCATFAPNRVLHNIMAIFTFMGSSILRQDDAFSFQIISNILETIVPLLVKNKDSSELSDSAITSVLRVFASSIPDIPDHRRIPLLLKLMKILHDGDYLHVLVILSLECSAKCTANNKAASAKYIEVVQEVCLLLPVRVLLACFQKLMVLINALPFDLEEETRKPTPYDSLIDLTKYTKKEFCHFNYITLNFISTILSNTKFINEATFVEKNESKIFEDYFKGNIEQTLLYVKSVTDYSSNAKNAKNASTKYWKAIISQSLEILNKTNALLTNKTFLTVVHHLLNHESLTVQRKTMEILNWRLQQCKEDETKCFKPDELMPLIPLLIKVVDSITNNLEDDGFDLKLNQQIALISLKLITRNCRAFDRPNEFKSILLKLTMILHDNIQMNDHVLACLVLCVAELISSLKIHAVESLPKFMPVFLQLFKKFHDNELSQSDVILLSIITTLQKIIEIIPNFLSPHLETILFEVCRLTEKLNRAEAKKNDDVKQSNISHKLKSIRLKISSEIPSRVLLPATSSCFTKFCSDSNFTAVEYLMNILAESFPNNGQVSVDLISLFISVLDFRCTSDVSEDIINQVEDYVIDSLCKIVLKCSESTFRPFYHKLYEWGIIASKDIAKKNRVITYYKILSKVSEKLKSIFVIFASNFIRNAAELLDKNNISKCKEKGSLFFPNDIEKTVLLVDSILVTLHNIFKYDTIKFLTKERFNLLTAPLIDQIENVIGDYEKRSEKIIIPCLSHFATATTDDFLWKQFSYSVLLKTRHVSPEVRLTALEVICMFATQLGDNFLPFLPETVPFIAELLEDENEIVEKRTHKVVQKLEQVLDEPIQKYF